MAYAPCLGADKKGMLGAATIDIPSAFLRNIGPEDGSQDLRQMVAQLRKDHANLVHEMLELRRAG